MLIVVMNPNPREAGRGNRYGGVTRRRGGSCGWRHVARGGPSRVGQRREGRVATATEGHWASCTFVGHCTRVMALSL